MSERSCDQLCPITDHQGTDDDQCSPISATCQCSVIMPAVSAHQCHQCYMPVPISATSMPHISAHLSCLSVSPISAANQCHLSVPVSATYQCQSVSPISAA
ncbi:unnamed protein product [Staurois parvus]|uniref:Uncharacterized protein n=1 Tax=Staurois parvus TaxID=386267 RepID=A0ABN9CWT6_9NEOB|nr:unnamed protein product [Staurois parvus]